MTERSGNEGPLKSLLIYVREKQRMRDDREDWKYWDSAKRGGGYIFSLSLFSYTPPHQVPPFSSVKMERRGEKGEETAAEERRRGWAGGELLVERAQRSGRPPPNPRFLYAQYYHSKSRTRSHPVSLFKKYWLLLSPSGIWRVGGKRRCPIKTG